MASAVGWERGIVLPESGRKGTATWLDDRSGGPPLRFDSLPEGRKNRTYTKEERNAVVDYAVRQRWEKSVNECAKECGATGSSVSRWIRDECEAYPEVATVEPDVYAGKIADYRDLLIELRQWSGIKPIFLSDHFKDSVGGWGLNRGCPTAEEQSRDGHPYFPQVRGVRRIFTKDQKERAVNYWYSGCGGDSVKKYARECGLFPSTMHEWIDEVGGSSSSGLPGGRGSPNSECGSSLHDVEQLRPTSAEKDISTRLAERMDGTPPLKRRKREGTAIWLDDRFGGPPLRFASLPKGKRRRYTEEERGAVVDYAVEQREMKTIGECTKEIGVGAGCISKWLREACEAYQAFSESDLNDTLRVIDCRKLLPDLRAGKTSLCVSDYTGGEKYSNGKRGQKLKGVRAREEDRDGRLYFASPEKGELRVFAKDQKERAVDYWLGEFEGDSISNCAKELNLHADTLIGWVGGGGRGRKRRSLHTTESPGNSPEATDSDPDEVSLPDIPVEDVNRLLPIEPS